MRKMGWGSPSSNKGTCTVVLCIYKYFVAHLFEASELVLLLRPRLLIIEAGEVPLRPVPLLIR